MTATTAPTPSTPQGVAPAESITAAQSMPPSFILPAALAAAVSAVAARVRLSVTEVHTRGGTGSGTIWTTDGLVVTNHHVLPSERATVTLADGRTFEGHVVARDARNDLAVLRVHTGGAYFPATQVGNARTLRPGEMVLAVGNPVGVRGAVTIGVVHRALPRSHAGRGRELVQADVLLGPGNSGGPLVDAHGSVVGINAMVQGGIGRMALAVPSHVVTRLLGRSDSRPELGISAQEVPLPETLASRAAVALASGQPGAFPGAGRASHVSSIETPESALLVMQVVPGGVADRAGLLLGDLLYALDGEPVEGGAGLLNALDGWSGTPLRLGVLRGGAPREVLVAFATQPADNQMPVAA